MDCFVASINFLFRNELNSETSFWGFYSSYNGGGYIGNLGLTIEGVMKIFQCYLLKLYFVMCTVTSIKLCISDAQNMTKELEIKQWLDTLTRAVNLEFNVYNPDTNLFSLVSCLIEFPAHGGAIVTRDVNYFVPFSSRNKRSLCSLH